MADFAGLLTIVLLLIVARSIVPIPFPIMLASIAVVPALNVALWQNFPNREMPARQVLRTAAIGSAILIVMAAARIEVSYLTGRRTLFDVLLRSSPLGTSAMISAALAVFVGVPTLVRAVVMVYEQPHA